MTKTLMCLCFLVPSVAFADARIEEPEPGKKWIVTFDAIPKTVDEFVALRDSLAKTPQGGIAAFLIAGMMLGEDETVGEQALITALASSNLVEAGNQAKRPTYKGYMVGTSVGVYLSTSNFGRNRAYVGKSYVQGTTWEASYALPPAPYKLVITKHTMQPTAPDRWKGLSPSSCAENAKPYEVVKNDKGIWKIDNPSSFFAGCRPPPAAKKDDL